LLRGAATGIPAVQRLAGLIPTPALPERALEALAQQPTTRALAAMLVSWRNPYGAVLLTEAARAKPDLLCLELALDRAFAKRAGAAAGRQHELREFVAETIDLQNINAALVLARGLTATDIEAAFLPGGRHVGLASFVRAASAPVAGAALQSLQRDIHHPVLADALRAAAGPASMERAALRARVRAWARRALAAPLGPAPILAYVLRLRAEAMDLLTVAWRLSLGMTPQGAAEMVSP
jgi:vacuolar-type H+-ATPase subunit C/Vma6